MPANSNKIIQPSQQKTISTSSSTSSTSSSSSSTILPVKGHISGIANMEIKKEKNVDYNIQNRNELSNFANRRESLFYHSVDNQRINQRQHNLFIEYQQKLLKEQQKKFLEQQQKLCENRDYQVLFNENDNKSESLLNGEMFRSNRLQSKYIQKKNKINEQVMHSIPFNVTNQVQPICDLFNYENNIESVKVNSNFKRLELNQLSTKSQPPCKSESYKFPNELINRSKQEKDLIDNKNIKICQNIQQNIFYKIKGSEINENNKLLIQQPAQV